MSKIRVLLAEDHAVVREGTSGLFSREDDLEVVGEAADGEEAVKMADELAPDVVVMDISMPVLNGIEATKRIKEADPSIAVLILTAYDNDQYIFAVLEAGAAGYLLKNISGRELVGAVRAVHAGESILHPIVARKVVDRFMRQGAPAQSEESGEVLSERELRVLKLAARGLSNKDIAQELFLSVRTVQSHLGNIFNKLRVGSRTEAVLRGLKKGWITLQDLP